LSDQETKEPASQGSKRFGAFGGVFTPSVLTILGVIMYLRMGWVTGELGLGGALLVVLVAHLISIATSLSVSSIATNRRVGAGGAYFMISRALGGPVGAAVGIPLFLAQAISVTFYIIGFTEAVSPLLPEAWQTDRVAFWISTAVNILLTGLSFKSADLAIKTQYFVMTAIALSLLSFFFGTTPSFPVEVEYFREGGASFFEVFAVFFPAVTGIMAGVGMSGDLRDSRTAIPRGTMAAVFTGLVVYCAVPVWLSANASNLEMSTNNQIVWQISAVPSLIYAGVWGATLSSAIGCILTAPRTLQALAADRILPAFFAQGSGPANEPRRGVLVTFTIAQAGIWAGSLDAIAPVLTMFFLATYGVTNLACGLERWAANPSFRPSFRVPATISFVGGIACFYVMSIINLPAMVVSLIFCVLIFLLVSRRTLGTTYGDARHGIWSALVRGALLRLRRSTFHPQNWRPNMILLGGNPDKRSYLLQLGNAIVQDRGLITYFHLLLGDVAEQAETRKTLLSAYDEIFADRFPNVFYRVDIVPSIYHGTVSAAQSYGLGSFESNCVMLGWPRKPERSVSYVEMLRNLVHLDRSLLLVKHDASRDFGDRKDIHVWWGGLQGNGGLMLLLAYLINADFAWRRAQVTVLTVVGREEDLTKARGNITRLLEDARLSATPRVILRGDDSIPQIMHRESAGADLAVVGIRLPKSGEDAQPFFDRMNTILDPLPTTLLVHSARSFDGEPVLFDSEAAPETSS